MANFSNTLNPTPFSFFDADNDFQVEADAMITFVKRKLGDDVLSVELTRKQIWGCFEESTLEYSSIINQYQAKSQLANLLGGATGSLDGQAAGPRLGRAPRVRRGPRRADAARGRRE